MDDRFMDTLVEVARRWRDPSYEPRQAAVDETLAADNRFTDESVAFAVNHFVHQLTPEIIERWLANRSAVSSGPVGVVPGGRTPLEGLRSLLAGLLVGHRCIYRAPDRSPALIPAFLDDLSGAFPQLDIERVRSLSDLVERASAVVVSGGPDLIDRLADRCDRQAVPADRRLVRTVQYAVGVIDGEEDEEARSGLAEDMLLFEGESPCSLAVLWAPIDHSPDPYLAVLPQFRELFPPHDATDGSLAMPRAFLEARDQGHAYGIGFLVSRGAPERRRAAHVRWTEYSGYEMIDNYLTEHREEISLVAAEPRVGRRLNTSLSIVEPGSAHRRPLDWDPHPPGIVEWLVNL